MAKKPTLKQAIAELDHADDNHWTGDGLPRLDVLKELTGEHVTRKDVTKAAPDFDRSAAQAKADKSKQKDKDETETTVILKKTQGTADPDKHRQERAEDPANVPPLETREPGVEGTQGTADPARQAEENEAGTGLDIGEGDDDGEGDEDDGEDGEGEEDESNEEDDEPDPAEVEKLQNQIAGFDNDLADFDAQLEKAKEHRSEIAARRDRAVKKLEKLKPARTHTDVVQSYLKRSLEQRKGRKERRNLMMGGGKSALDQHLSGRRNSGKLVQGSTVPKK